MALGNLCLFQPVPHPPQTYPVDLVSCLGTHWYILNYRLHITLHSLHSLFCTEDGASQMAVEDLGPYSQTFLFLEFPCSQNFS